MTKARTPTLGIGEVGNAGAADFLDLSGKLLHSLDRNGGHALDEALCMENVAGRRCADLANHVHKVHLLELLMCFLNGCKLLDGELDEIAFLPKHEIPIQQLCPAPEARQNPPPPPSSTCGRSQKHCSQALPP